MTDTTKAALDEAREIETNLRDRHADALTALAQIEDRRAALAYDAMIGKGDALKSLEKLNRERADLERDIGTLAEAIAEAGRRVADAQSGDKDAAERDRARKALALLDSFEKRGAALDAAFDSAIGEYKALSEEFRELDSLGYPPTTFALVKVQMAAAASTKLMFTDMQSSFLAPHERRSFVASIMGWASHARARAEGRLNRRGA